MKNKQKEKIMETSNEEWLGILFAILFVVVLLLIVVTILVLESPQLNKKGPKRSKTNLSSIKSNKTSKRKLAIIHHRKNKHRKSKKQPGSSFQPSKNQTVNHVSYVREVYPISTNPELIVETLQFFYQDLISNDIIQRFGKHFPPPPDSNRNYQPPKFGELWVPIWFPENTFVINGYKPDRFWEGNLDSDESQFGNYFEVMHVPDDDQSWYVVYGTWFYVTRGTGVWLDCGPRTLRSINKIHALKDLGLNVLEIATLFQDAEYMINVNENAPSLAQLASGQVVQNIAYPGSSSEEQIQNMLIDYFKMMDYYRYKCDRNQPVDQQIVSKLYQLDRINNSADYDEWINLLARTQGYEAVHFTIQANGNGGWAHELVYVNQSMFLGTDEKRMATLANRLYIADPLNPIEFRERCKFVNNDAYQCLSCTQQKRVWDNCNVLVPPNPPTPAPSPGPPA